MEHGIKTGLELKIEIEETLFETCQLIVVGGYWPGFLVTCICHRPEIFSKSVNGICRRRSAIIALIAFLFPPAGPLPAPEVPAKSNLNEGLSHNSKSTFSLQFLRTSLTSFCWPKDLYSVWM